MALTVVQLISDVARELQDQTHVRWMRTELLDYFNAGQRLLAQQRPDQLAQALNLSLSGWRNVLPSDVHTLIDITNNANAGLKRVTKVDAWTLDAVVAGWRGATPAAEVMHYMYDIRHPQEFWVYPPARSGLQVQAVVQMAVKDLADEGANPSVPLRWMDALRDFVLFRAWSKDAEFGGNAALAAAHLALFNNALGVQTKAANEVAPQA